MRSSTNGQYPTFAIWENVPGAFSSSGGEDFRAVLEELATITDSNASIPRPEDGKWRTAGAIMGDGWSIACRVLDAQFWGVPQRRRRIYAVADFRGNRAAEILFDDDRVQGYLAARGKTWQGFAAGVERCAHATGGNVATRSAGFIGDNSITAGGVSYHEEQSATLTGTKKMCAAFLPRNGAKASGIWSAVECSPTMKTYGPPACIQPVADTLTTRCGSSSPMGAQLSGIVGVTLDCRNYVANHEISGTIQAKEAGGYSLNYINPVSVLAFDTTQITSCGNYSNPHYGELSHPLAASSHAPSIIKSETEPKQEVRRLTPLECERLQGYPDDWTKCGYDGAIISDTARYRALGNSLAIPCAYRVMAGIRMALEEEK